MAEGPRFAPVLPGSILLDFEGDHRDIDAYIAAGGYEQLKRSLGLTTDEIVNEIMASGVRGRGGAGFPTGRKASFLAPPHPRYLVVNADESEPGTFKDRELILRNPHALIEGILIMCWAIRAAQAFIYIRGEYLTEYEVLVDAVAQARARGWVNHALPGTDYTPDIVVHRGAGAYICGEETALLNSLNGNRGQPTAKPPFPAVAGAFKKPTLLNNVETLATVPYILRMGGEQYASIGTEQSKGTRVFSLSGQVKKPGNYELPLTATFRDLIEGCGEGMLDGRSLKCFVPGGSSMPVLMPDQLDVGLAFEAVAAAGSMSGSGGVIVIDDSTCMVQFALRTAEFYRHESCGKCTPCREGTRWTVDLLTRIETGVGTSEEIDLLLDVCDRIEGKCLCPLGDACAMPVRSHILRFREEFEAHVRDGLCPFGETSALSTLAPKPKIRLPLVSV
jgi:NADH-quinone oxidoreductase subunit F